MPATMVSAADMPVLVGCSEPRMVASLAGMLEELGHPVDVAENGRTALERLERSDPPGIALLDMDLPTPTGVEVVWELSRRRERSPAWLVLMSRIAGKDRLRAALECGCDDFMALPADAMDLKLRIRVAERVREVLRHAQMQEAELHYQSTHDGLTGLWNREALLRLLFQETDRVQRMKTDLSLMLMDLDEFSRVNHEYGYEAGDEVLSGLANRFRRQLRSYDLIGRCGEDEFLLALPGCGRENAVALAERIRMSILARPFAVGNAATTLTASFGIASSRGRSPLVVLREAERAVQAAKQAGKNCVRCSTAMEALPIVPPSVMAERAG
jgi:two-component system cell cycle response regulator